MGCAMIEIRPTQANARCDSCCSDDTDQIVTISAEHPHDSPIWIWLCRRCITTELIPSLATTWPPIVTTRIVGVMAPRP